MIFTKRELTVLHLLARGKTSGQIAEELKISAHTVKTYMTRLRHHLQGTGLKLDNLKGLSPEFLEEWAKNYENESRQ